jgi:hypothetical protein
VRPDADVQGAIGMPTRTAFVVIYLNADLGDEAETLLEQWV